MSIKKPNKTITKPPNVFSYLKSLSQKAKDLSDETGDVNDNIGHGKLLFIGSNKEKFNFNIVKKPLNFISGVCNLTINQKIKKKKKKCIKY